MRFLALLALLVLVVGVWRRGRLRALRRHARFHLDDEMIRRIETEGRLLHEADEPLDLEEIREQEDAFWDQTWDEPEEL
ncbi:MAG: hypothetical protein ACE5HQ_09675 [Gemmatimonadota bacterium]